MLWERYYSKPRDCYRTMRKGPPGLLGPDREEVFPLGHGGIRELADLEGNVAEYYIVAGLSEPESPFKKANMDKRIHLLEVMCSKMPSI